MDDSDEDYQDKLNKHSSVHLVKLGLLVVINRHVFVDAAPVVGPVSQRAKLFGKSLIVDRNQNNHSDCHSQENAILDDAHYSVTELLAAATEHNTVHDHVDELYTTKGTSNNPNCLVESSGIRFGILHPHKDIVCIIDRVVTVNFVVESSTSPELEIKFAFDLVRLGQVCRVGRH